MLPSTILYLVPLLSYKGLENNNLHLITRYQHRCHFIYIIYLSTKISSFISHRRAGESLQRYGHIGAKQRLGRIQRNFVRIRTNGIGQVVVRRRIWSQQRL